MIMVTIGDVTVLEKKLWLHLNGFSFNIAIAIVIFNNNGQSHLIVGCSCSQTKTWEKIISFAFFVVLRQIYVVSFFCCLTMEIFY